MLSGVQLPFRFDAAGLRADLGKVQTADWAPHYNERDYGGVWRGAALRSASGEPGDLRSVAASFHDTELLHRCPRFREVVGAFHCRVKAARLLGLAPGSFIREHSDHALDYEDGEARIHVPVQTNGGVEFYVQGERLLMEEGGAYYVNVNLPHRVNNRGEEERIHLVIDVEVNDWVREVFSRSSEIPRCAAPARGVEEFRDAGDPTVREALRAIEDSRVFAAEAVRLGRERGFEFHEGDVDAMLTGVARPGVPGGLTYRLEVRAGEPYLWWTDAPERGLAEPFFEETVQATLRSPWGKFRRRVARLEERDARPKGFLFHMSRCGSTLAAQLLKAAGYRVASEAPPVDAALAVNPGWLPAVMAALDADFVKFDAWHAHRLPEIRAAFPETPWIFVRRDPGEVMASHWRCPGMHALPGAMDPAALGMTMDEVTGLSRKEWLERVLSKIVASAERHLDGSGLWVEYRELPDAMWGRVARHFGLELTPEQIERMREAARFDAKSPGRVWAATEPDTP